jgi:succinyl-CoA synthetase beta subunit
MSRAKLSEYRAKVLLGDALQAEYVGFVVNARQPDSDQINDFMNQHGARYVIKVDQAIKQRNKLGLVDLHVTSANVESVIKKYAAEGYQWLLLEPFMSHRQTDERFIAMELTANGVDITYSAHGGVDIESHADSLQKFCVESNEFDGAVGDISAKVLKSLLSLFARQHLTYLEINPFVTTSKGIVGLDAAFEVDSSAAFFVDGWSLDDIRTPIKNLNQAEKRVEELASNSSASLSLKVLREDGAIFLLLSGGGASVVVLDELFACGLQNEIANYGEYSGNPSEEETYLYASQILKLLIQSKAKSKVLLIAGGVANFTDIHHTFKGIVRALSDSASQLRKQRVAIIVRRGGPNQEKGLAFIKEYLNREKIISEVYDPSTTLSQAVARVAKAVT